MKHLSCFLVTKLSKLGVLIVTTCICPQKHDVPWNNLPLHKCEAFSFPRNSNPTLHVPGRKQTTPIGTSPASGGVDPQNFHFS